jgi:hypothetical protein
MQNRNTRTRVQEKIGPFSLDRAFDDGPVSDINDADLFDNLLRVGKPKVHGNHH